MGTDLQAPTTYSDGQTINAAQFMAHVNNALILATAISSKAAKSPLALTDEFLINDSGTLRKATGQSIQSLAAVPIGVVMDYAGASPPGDWLFCFGQAISRITYVALFGVIGTTYGAGDGSTTFALPDCRGRVVAGKDDMGGTTANRLTTATGGPDGDILGQTGGSESHTLTVAQMPVHTHPYLRQTNASGSYNYTGGASAETQILDNTSAAGSSQPHNIVQPTIVLNKIIRAI